MKGEQFVPARARRLPHTTRVRVAFTAQDRYPYAPSAGRFAGVTRSSADVTKGGEKVEVVHDTGAWLWRPGEGDYVIHHEVADSLAPPRHATDDAITDIGPDHYPPPGEPCM